MTSNDQLCEITITAPESDWLKRICAELIDLRIRKAQLGQQLAQAGAPRRPDDDR